MRIFKLYSLIALIGLSLIFIRFLSPQFVLGTTTFDHPYIEFAAALMGAGFIWIGLISLLKRMTLTSLHLYTLLALALLYRMLFIGSVAIYEDDWNRYLWDGAVITKGINPYSYSPNEVLQANPESNEALKRLNIFAQRHDYFPKKINHPYLRTIYPPVAQAIFAIAAMIKPLDLDVLRVIFIAIDGLVFFLLIKALTLYGRDPKWALLYAFNPLLIYAGFNVAHMDILLLPFLLLALIWVKDGRAPFKAGLALSCAAAVKLWPLILAPILFRHWRRQPVFYIIIAAFIALSSLVLNLPLLLSIGEQSGLSAYAQQWQRSSFLFPLMTEFISHIATEPARIARIFVALSLTGLSLYMGFLRPIKDKTLPLACLILTAVLLFLSPTGYPWYLYWFFIFIPFIPSYGLGLLSVLVGLYYVRYALGERNIYHIYTDYLVPLQFALPLIIIGFEGLRFWRRSHRLKG